MRRALLIFRPEPGAAATVARAQAQGLAAVAAPLFTVAPVAWEPPDPAGFDAVMLTSANAVRHGGEGLARYRHLPVYTVGAATAAAARSGGFATVYEGQGDAEALLSAVAASGARRILHLAGREHRAVEFPRIVVERRVIYAAKAARALPTAAREALAGGAVALLHSPRAARLFRDLAEAAGLAPAALRIAAISPAALAAAGPGWAAAAAAASPEDDALLAAAAGLCD